MSTTLIAFLVGVFVGCNVAILILGLLMASRDHRAKVIGRDEIDQLKR